MVEMTTKDMVYEIPNLGCLLGMAYQAELSRLSRVLGENGLGITAAEYLIIRLLLTRGKMQQCELSRTLNKDRASISRSIKSLENKGMVRVNQISYKCCIVSLTEQGRGMEPRVLDVAEKMQQGLAERITPGQMSNLREILKEIIK